MQGDSPAKRLGDLSAAFPYHRVRKLRARQFGMGGVADET
jgi:hypothetical protein